jgi:hypothetical protein
VFDIAERRLALTASGLRATFPGSMARAHATPESILLFIVARSRVR